MQKTSTLAMAEGELRRLLERIGPSESVNRFLAKYGPVRTKRNYASQLLYYFQWLKAQRVDLSPDELIQDNIVKVLKSDPTDVKTRRWHTDLLLKYVNEWMAEDAQDYSQGSRVLAATVVRRFYERNDSELWGDFAVSFVRKQDVQKPISIEDIRLVLAALPLNVRLPFLLQLQAGLEIDKVLSLRWGDLGEGLDGGERPLKLTFSGRKRMIKPYFTFIGSEACELLLTWRARWTDRMGRRPQPSDLVLLGKTRTPMDYGWLGGCLKINVRRLFAEGLIKNGDPDAWSSHAFRKGFKTEASHAKLDKDMVEFFMGHERGVVAVYDRSDELHERDYAAEYRRLEPFVSMKQDEASIRGEFEDREKVLRQEIDGLRKNWETLLARLQSAGIVDSSPQPRP